MFLLLLKYLKQSSIYDMDEKQLLAIDYVFIFEKT